MQFLLKSIKLEGSTEASLSLSTCKNTIESPECAFDKTGFIPEKQCGFSEEKTIYMISSREMSRAKCGPLYVLCRPHQSI